MSSTAQDDLIVTSSPLGIAPAARVRRWRWAALVLVIVLGVAVLLTVVGRSSGGTAALDPDSAAPDGARAVRVLLEDQGVQVTRVATSSEALTAAPDDGLLVVVSAGRLTNEAVQRLRDYTGDLVLVEPTARVVEALVPGIEVVDELTVGPPGRVLLRPGHPPPARRTRAASR